MVKQVIAVLAVALMVTSCRKPVNEPAFETIDTSETAFMIPLEDDTGKQVKLNSEEVYQKLQVSAKRIQIPKRWQQTGRYGHQGEWIPTVRVVKVNRAPVTRELTPDANSGTSTKDDAIWSESSDSVGFSLGINFTGFIAEKDTAKFLYWYPSGSMANVMDTEIRSRIQQSIAETSGLYAMDVLREKKSEMMANVRKDVIPFFGERGITITTIGMFGGFTYENPEIQKSIDDVFVAQQEKAKELALLDAMETKKQRMQEEGTATANQAREVAKGEADAVLTRKEAEAKGIQLVNAALEQAKSNPLFVQIKALEVESERIQKWGGEVPTMIMGGGDSGFVPMIQLPELTQNK